MRLLHYPPQGGVIDDRVQGIGAHTEYVDENNSFMLTNDQLLASYEASPSP